MRASSTTKKPFTVWFTGLPKSGKSTLALTLRDSLRERGIIAKLFDGDSLRQSFWSNLGFTKKDRDEIVKRITKLCMIYEKHRLSTIVAVVSGYAEARGKVRNRLGKFMEVYVKCPVQVCIKRDEGFLYRKAIRGEISNFTGISDPYEEPRNPEVVCETNSETIGESLAKVVSKLEELDWI